MNETTNIADILAVAGGNKDFKVGFYTSEILMIGAVILVAVFLAVAAANLVTKK